MGCEYDRQWGVGKIWKEAVAKLFEGYPGTLLERLAKNTKNLVHENRTRYLPNASVDRYLYISVFLVIRGGMFVSKCFPLACNCCVRQYLIRKLLWHYAQYVCRQVRQMSRQNKPDKWSFSAALYRPVLCIVSHGSVEAVNTFNTGNENLRSSFNLISRKTGTCF